MRVVIAGGRDFVDHDLMFNSVNQLIDAGYIEEEGLEIVCGMARGADMTGYALALANGLTIHEFPADWGKFPRSAGMIRNSQMAVFAEAAVIFWDGKSRGTKNMIEQMDKLNKPCYVFNY